MQVMPPSLMSQPIESRPPAMSKQVNTISGIDPTAPGGIDALFAFHRSLWGTAIMQDPASVAPVTDGTPPVAAVEPVVPVVEPVAPIVPVVEPVAPVEPVVPVVDPVAPVEPVVEAVAPVVTPVVDEDAVDVPEGKAVTDLPDWAQKELSRARTQASDRRVKLNAALGDIKSVGGELGLVETAEAPITAAAILDAIKSQRSELTSLKTESALSAAITKAGGNSMTRSMVLGEGLTKDLDPAADDFLTKVEAAVTETIAKYPALKAAQAAGGSGLDLSGAPAPGAITVASFKAMSLPEKNALFQRDPALFRQLAGRN